MSRSKKISVIIVNWNGEKIIGECLNSIFTQAYKNIEVIIVDNNSSDNSVEFIKSNYKKAKIIQSPENLGFAAGNNKGVEYATGEYILLLNNDAVVTKDFLQPLVDALEQKNAVGVVQPMIIYTDNEIHKKGDINSAGTLFLNTGFLYYIGYGKDSRNLQYKKPRSIFTAFGACMLIKKEVIDSVGLFDSDYFMYFEETDFCMRTLLSGWEILYIPNSQVFHKGGVSARSYGNSRIYYHSFKNRISSYIKNFERLTLLTVLPTHLLICQGIAGIYLITGEFSYFLAVEKAFLWNIRKLRLTLKKRSQIQQKLRKIPDRQYLPNLTIHPRLSYYLYLFRGLQYYKE